MICKAKIDPLRSASKATMQCNTSKRVHKQPCILQRPPRGSRTGVGEDRWPTHSSSTLPNDFQPHPKYANFRLCYTVLWVIKSYTILHLFGSILLLLTVPVPFRHYLSVISRNWLSLFTNPTNKTKCAN